MSNHQKRLSAPRDYPVERKNGAYVVAADGPHPASEGVPLAVVLRDILGYAETLDEVKELLGDGRVLVNGRERRNPGTTAGFMDVFSFPGIDEHYRVLVTADGLALAPIDADEAEQKLARVDDKTTLKGGETQLNLHDGNNIITDDGIDTKGSVLITLPDLDIEEEIPFEEGNLAYVTGGKHVGETAEIVSIDIQPGSQENTVTLDADGTEFVTVEANVYMIGEDDPVLTVMADE